MWLHEVYEREQKRKAYFKGLKHGRQGRVKRKFKNKPDWYQRFYGMGYREGEKDYML